MWAFGAFRAANWHPLTWLSHMLDVELFGADAGKHHLVNVAFHGVNTLLLFWMLRNATGATVRSIVVAALFAVHPLHVESVAWISERKDVLSTAFLLITIGSYVRYARTGLRRAYVATACFLAMGLLAKPMLVTAPFLLLLLDAWPLNRLPLGSGSGFARALGRRTIEKLPLFLISLGASIVTYLAQSAGGGERAVFAYTASSESSECARLVRRISRQDRLANVTRIVLPTSFHDWRRTPRSSPQEPHYCSS